MFIAGEAVAAAAAAAGSSVAAAAAAGTAAPGGRSPPAAMRPSPQTAGGSQGRRRNFSFPKEINIFFIKFSRTGRGKLCFPDGQLCAQSKN